MTECYFNHVWEAPGNDIEEKMQNNLTCAERRMPLGKRMAIMIVGLVLLIIVIGVGVYHSNNGGIQNYTGYVIFGLLSFGIMTYGFFADKIEILSARQENLEFNTAWTRRIMNDSSPPEFQDWLHDDFIPQKRTEMQLAAIQRSVRNNTSSYGRHRYGTHRYSRGFGNSGLTINL